MDCGRKMWKPRCGLSVLVLLCVVQSTFSQAHDDLYEGSDCTLPGKVAGTCRLLSDCPSQLELLRSRTGRPRNQYYPQRCSFQGAIPIVCCANEKPSTPAEVTVVAPGGPPTTTVSPKTTVVVNRIMAGEKSKKACEEYSNEIPRQVIPLIHDGVRAIQGEFPHMALLGYIAQGQKELSWNCGGSLISDRFVVTAAHCFTHKLLRVPVRVRLGEDDLNDNKDQAEDYGIERYVIHPEYNPRSWYHDLALINLNRKVKFTSYIQPACLWTRPEDPEKGLVITGWGSTSMDGGTRSNILLKGNRTLVRVAPDVCSKSFRAASSRLSNGIQKGMLCAIDPVGSVDTCGGDSGGPIQISTGQPAGVGYFIVGVTSGGSSLCGGKTPAIYTRLYNYLDWIEGVVWTGK